MEEIHKELRVRSRITSIYNKRRDDFNTKDAWDDYLESAEDIIFNLVNRIDVAETEARVGEYKRANQLSIIANQARAVEEQKQVQVAAAAAAAAAAGGTDEPTAPGASAASAPAYAPAFKPQALIAAQPLPLTAPAVGANGSFIVPRVSRADFPAMASASGWSPQLPRARALQEAFSSMLIWSRA
ncbi:hypothetical protein FOA52_001248 [Chlamydomonas sp. UWO 241]|nr:hypothetical protein FOA52_001248 [Chlamydomonas sp. UWO 241]